MKRGAGQGSSMPAPLSSDLRERVIRAWQSGSTYEQCAARFSIGRATVDRVIRRFRKTGAVDPLPHGGGHPRALPVAARHVLADLVQAKPDTTMRELRRAVKELLGIDLSEATIGRELREFGLTLKKKSITAEERMRPDVQLRRTEFLRKVRHLDPEHLIFVDETGTHIAMTRTHAWAPRGQRVVGVIPRNRGTVLTVIGAFSIDGFEVLDMVVGATDGAVFRSFVRSRLAPVLQFGDVVVMDDLGAHHAKGVRELIEACGATVMPLPPYSPDLSPIEHAWSKMKEELRQVEARTVPSLKNSVIRLSHTISPSDAAGWFKHCGIL